MDTHHSDLPQQGKKYTISALIIGALLIGAIFFGGVYVGGHSLAAQRALASTSTSLLGPPEGVDFSPVWKAWNIINAKYVASGTGTTTPVITDQDKVWGMVQGLAGALEDPYTVFLPPTEAELFQEDISGAFEGVGMEIAIRNQILTVVSPLKGTPAFRAGLKPADSIIKIDGVDTTGMSIQSAVKRIRGPRDTVVVLSIVREGERAILDIPVTRDVISIPTINTTKRDDGIFVIELLNFSAVSQNLFREALREFIDTGYTKLILDLRGNPGGFLQASVDMASWYLPSGAIVVTEDYGKNGKSIVHRSRGYNIFTDELEMVILVDKGSASASEILAGALRDHNVATLIGTQTFGKGSVQELVDITSETALKVTVARWLLPLGASIHKDGLTPDIVVDIDPDTDPLVDPILNRAVEELTK